MGEQFIHMLRWLGITSPLDSHSVPETLARRQPNALAASWRLDHTSYPKAMSICAGGMRPHKPQSFSA